MESLFPESYPKNLLELIVEDGAEANEIVVFRICRNGVVNRDSFVSTVQDPYQGIKNKNLVNRDLVLSNNDNIDISHYSTSCFEELSDVNRIFGAMQKTTPKQIIAKGITDPSCGLSLRSKMSRSRKKNKGSHVDWWIYKDANPEDFFAEYTSEMEMIK